MKKLFVLTVYALLFGICLTAAVSAQSLDLSMRQAAYFNFKEDGSIDLKGKYVPAGGTITIKKSSATSCQNDECQFAIGFILFRNIVDTDPVVKVNVESGKTESLFFQFKKDDKTKMARHTTPFLKIGANKIKILLDADNKIVESNENNNSIEITIVVEP